MALWSTAKARAKERGLIFSITLDDFTIPQRCPVLGIPLVVLSKRQLRGDTSPTLDRILPHLGYVAGNVRVISFRANLLKSNATLAEHEAVLQDARRIYAERDV
jgi:hypothetical protein